MSVAIIQPNRAIRIPVNGIEIPYPANALTSASSPLVNSSSASTVINATVDFVALGVRIGDIVYNTNSPTLPLSATITSVVSANQLSLSSSIFGLINSPFVIYQSSANNGVLHTPVLYIGGFGGVTVETEGGELAFFGSINTGTFLPVKIRRVLTSGAGGTTTASNLVALF
jgi:hypothetical protein